MSGPRRPWRRWAALALVALVVLLGIAGAAMVATWRPSPAQFAIQGVDLDERAGAVDWPSVKAAGADFGYVRATAGAGTRDARFAANWAGLAAAGMRRGAIHVFSLCRLAADQAANFVRTVPRSADTLPHAIALDFDPACPSRPDRAVVLGEIRTLLDAIETHSGKPVLLRVAKPFEAAYRVTEAIDRPLWSVQMFFPPEYAHRGWRLWQAHPARRVAGAEQPVGWDVVRP